MNLICLDLDGTLEDSRADMVAAIHRVRAQLGLPERPEATLRPFVSKGMDTLYLRCFDDFGVAQDPSAYARVEAAYESDYLANVAITTRLYPRHAHRPGPRRARHAGRRHQQARAHLARTSASPRHRSALRDRRRGDSCAESKPSSDAGHGGRAGRAEP
ncbi:MAG: hypothetical protein R3F60_22975 [bacterium]